TGQLGVLLDGRDQRAVRAHHHLAGADDPGALALEEVAVHRDRAVAGDPAVGEHARFADHQLRAFAQVDDAVLEQAVDLDAGAGLELEGRVLQDVAVPEVAARRGRGRLLRLAQTGEQHRDLAVRDAAGAVAGAPG